MKKLMALLLALTCLFGSAMSESLASPTDLEEFDDDDWGYIGFEFARKVFISLKEERLYSLGEDVTLIAVLMDFKPTDIVTFQWEYATDIEEPNWIFIENATEQTYTFTLDETNMLYWYRIVVTIGE